jgi:hypothetical protein
VFCTAKDINVFPDALFAASYPVFVYGAVEIVVKAKPDVFNHNIETVPSLYKKIRPGARYFHSLNLLCLIPLLLNSRDFCGLLCDVAAYHC